MKTLLFIILQGLLLFGGGSVKSGSSSLAVDLFAHMEITDPDATVITTAIVTSGSNIAATLTGTIAQSPTPLVDWFVDTTPCNSVQSPALPKSVTIDGVVYDGSTNTMAWQRTWNNNATLQSFQKNITGGTAGAIAAFWGWTCTNSFVNDGNNVSLDLYGVAASGGVGVSDSCLVQQFDSSGTTTNGLRMHDSNSNVSSTVLTTNNAWYFYTALADFTAGTCTEWVYNSSLTLLGTATLVLETGHTINSYQWMPENMGSSVRAGLSTWSKNVVFKGNVIAASAPYGLP